MKIIRFKLGLCYFCAGTLSYFVKLSYCVVSWSQSEAPNQFVSRSAAFTTPPIAAPCATDTLWCLHFFLDPKGVYPHTGETLRYASVTGTGGPPVKFGML